MAFIESRNFRSELFGDPREYEETPLRDRKRNFPNLHHLKVKAEFIRDVIAISNTAQYFNEPGYLLFGLDDMGKVHNIESELDSYRKEASNEHQIQENVRQYIGQTIQQYITPHLPETRLKWGWIDGSLVAYLQIDPPPRRPSFQAVAKDLNSGKEKLLHSGQSWLRFGESKQEVNVQEVRARDPRAEVPYVFPSIWLRYYEGLLTNRETQTAQDIRAYQELHLLRGKQLLSGRVSIFLESDKNAILIIKGPAGSGKSAWLHRLIYQWAIIGQSDMQYIRERERLSPPPNWIPIYFSLRDAEIPDVQALACALIRSVNRIATLWEAEEPHYLERLLEIDGPRWLVCLDGLDEMWKRERQCTFLRVLRAFQLRYPRVKVIVTTRSDFSVPGDLESVEIAPFSKKQVLAYLDSYVDRDQYEIVLGLMETSPTLWQLCKTPVYLEAIVEIISSDPTPSLEMENWEAENEPPIDKSQEESSPTQNEGVLSLPKIDVQQFMLTEPLTDESEGSEDDVEPEEGPPLTLGWVLDQAFQRLWKREVDRRLLLYDTANQWWNAIGEMALWMDGRRKSIRRRRVINDFLSEDGLRWVFSLGILCHGSRGGWVRFVVPLAKLYFAAVFLLPFVEDEICQDISLCVSECTSSFRQEMYDILQQLTYKDMETLFSEVKNE